MVVQKSDIKSERTEKLLLLIWTQALAKHTVVGIKKKKRLRGLDLIKQKVELVTSESPV